MTNQINALLDFFALNRTVALERETHMDYRIECKSKSLGAPNADQLVKTGRGFPDRDILDLSISIGESPSITFSSTNIDAWPAVLGDLSDKLEVAQPEDGFSITLVVSKTSGHGGLSVYSLDRLLQHLIERDTKECFSIFDRFISAEGNLVMACQFPVQKFGSKTIMFAQEDQHVEVVGIDREPLIAKRNDVAHFADGANFCLVPEDFRLDFDPPNGDWKRLFDRLANALSLAFTFDYSNFVDEDVLQYKINGYRTVTGFLQCKALSGPEWESAFEIYEWVYQGGAVSDKMGLLRNVATLHLDEKGQPKYDRDVYKSVCSGFEIYLKRNIGQYIEIKNRLADFIRSLSGEAREESGRYSTALVQTLGALLTFFITVFIVNAVAGKGLINVFTRDVTYLTYSFLAGSLAFLGISLMLFRRQRTRIENDYESVKRQYKDILDPDDLVRIFENDEPIKRICDEMRKVAIWVTVAWIVVIIALAVTAMRLHDHQLSAGSDTPQQSSLPSD